MGDAAAARANEPVPDMVRQFVVYFYRHIREKNGACIFLPMQPRESAIAPANGADRRSV